MKYIIIDSRNRKALYGIDEFTLQFSTEEIAKEVADQFFNPGDYIIIGIRTLNKQ